VLPKINIFGQELSFTFHTVLEMGVIAHLNLYWPSQMRRKTNVLVYSMVTELNIVLHEYIVDDFFHSY